VFHGQEEGEKDGGFPMTGVKDSLIRGSVVGLHQISQGRQKDSKQHAIVLEMNMIEPEEAWMKDRQQETGGKA
jgi:hypothetical protein